MLDARAFESSNPGESRGDTSCYGSIGGKLQIERAASVKLV